ncbi:MAG: 50S ribosomal protein L9 [Eubacteriaceae bacterium]|nr:50S ribosomal protein L9 [Eubacteriaceae bacterium]
MKVILLQTVKGLGKEGDIVNAKDGYATNFLFPKKLAVKASDENMNLHNEQIKQKEEQKLLEKQSAQDLYNKIHNKTFQLKAKAGSGKRLFGSVTSKEIADEISKVCNVNIDKRKIELDENIKEQGEKEILIKLHPDITAKVIINVTAQ